MTTDDKQTDGTEDMRKEAKRRAEECSAAVNEVLEQFQCKIVPMLTSEPVGTGPGVKVLMGATYGIMPEVVE